MLSLTEIMAGPIIYPYPQGVVRMRVMKQKFDVYKAKMEALLISQLELLKDINKE